MQKKAWFWGYLLKYYRSHLFAGIFNSISIAFVYWFYMTNKILDLKSSPSPDLTTEQILAYRESIQPELSCLYNQRLLFTIVILILSYPLVIFLRALVHERENLVKTWSSYKTNEFK